MSNSQTKIYLDLSPELQQLFNENNITIDEILRKENIQFELTYGGFPDELETPNRQKDVVTILIAGAAFTLAVGLTISRVLRALHCKPVLVKYFDFETLKDPSGKILKDKQGNPIIKRVEKYELLESSKQECQESLEIKLNHVQGVIIKFGSAENQINSKQ